MLSLVYLVAAAVLSVGVHGQGKWEFYAYRGLPGMLSYGRLDPIISPGEVSSHVHQFQGGNALSATYDYDTYRREGTCSTIQVQQDLSNYWAPALYHYDGASNFTLMLAGFHIYYQFLTYSYDPENPAGSSKRYAFPEGLTMLAGNINQRSINQSDPASTASIFNCQYTNAEGPYSYDMRDFQQEGINCNNSLRATTLFPSCWDGVADNSDLTHVVYPGPRPDGQLGALCPESHPMALMQLTYEWYWPVQDFPFDPSREDNWVFSFGDTSGFGFHGDFAMGWDVPLLEEAINSCNQFELGIEDCQPFAAYNDTTIPPCMPLGLYPNEDVGLDGHSLTALPGCNPLWTDNSTKPTCDVTPPTPSIDLLWGPDLSEWNYVSCPFASTDQGMILTAHSRLNWTDMTVDSCLAECSGYKYAMMDWGDNCFCDNEIQNGGTTTSDPNYQCQVRCPDKYLQFCGGLGSGELFQACTGDDCFQNSVLPPRTTAAPVWLQTGVSTTVQASATPSSTITPSSSSEPTSTTAAATSSTRTRSKVSIPTGTNTSVIRSASATSSGEVSSTVEVPSGTVTAAGFPPCYTTTTTVATTTDWVTKYITVWE